MEKRNRGLKLTIRVNEQERNKVYNLCKSRKIKINEFFLQYVNSEYEKMGVKDEKEK